MKFLKNRKKLKKAWDIAEGYAGKEQQKTDPMGSWTGKPKDKNEIPIQDADDL